MPESLTSPAVLDAFARASAAALDPDPANRPFPSPVDWRDHPIYFLLVDRFNNPDQPPRGDWDRPFGGFQGGTLEGVADQLDYIKALGFGAIWISPVQKNLPWEGFSYHGYGIHDFLAVEPRFASDTAAARADPTIAERELRALVDAAHARELYVILDVVINHVGNVFGYDPGPASQANSERPFKGLGGDAYPIFWRDDQGVGAAQATGFPANPSRDAVVWPREFQTDDWFRRRGVEEDSHPQEGDFASLKELVTELSTPDGRHPVRDGLIRALQYMIARYDIDGFRIDTLKHVEPAFARVFGNAMREYALSIGKRNFFTFGEVADAGNEAVLAKFIGRDTLSTDTGEAIGVDAALDFPLRAVLARYAKAGGLAPGRLAAMYQNRARAERTLLTSHGEAGQYFVTFLDNHDDHDFRFAPVSPAGTDAFDAQFALGFGCLAALQGIPCLYYGTEQGLTGMGAGTGDAGVREALWGKPNAFDRTATFYRVVQDLLSLRAREPALRYGRQYFRPVSGDGTTFGMSPFPDGVLAFSRVLNDREVVIVCNPNTGAPVSVDVLVDHTLNPEHATYRVLYSNSARPAPPGPAASGQGANIVVFELDGTVSNGGPVTSVRVRLAPMEIQIIAA
jgi:glycosidase